MRLCNSPDIFQEKMNSLFNGLVYVRACKDDLLIISNGNFEDHLTNVKIVLTNLKHLVSKSMQKNQNSPEIV